MRIIGVLLIVLGIIGFLIGGVTFVESEEVADLGPVEVERQEERTFPITPWASGAAVIAGIALVGIDVVREQQGRA